MLVSETGPGAGTGPALRAAVPVDHDTDLRLPRPASAGAGSRLKLYARLQVSLMMHDTAPATDTRPLAIHHRFLSGPDDETRFTPNQESAAAR